MYLVTARRGLCAGLASNVVSPAATLSPAGLLAWYPKARKGNLRSSVSWELPGETSTGDGTTARSARTGILSRGWSSGLVGPFPLSPVVPDKCAWSLQVPWQWSAERRIQPVPSTTSTMASRRPHPWMLARTRWWSAWPAFQSSRTPSTSDKVTTATSQTRVSARSGQSPLRGSGDGLGEQGKEGEEEEVEGMRKEEKEVFEESGSWYGPETKVNLRSQKSQHTCRGFQRRLSTLTFTSLHLPSATHQSPSPLPESAIQSQALPYRVWAWGRRHEQEPPGSAGMDTTPTCWLKDLPPLPPPAKVSQLWGCLLGSPLSQGEAQDTWQ